MWTIPNHAQQVRWWNLFRVYTRQQKMFDDSYQTFESVVQEDAVLMIVVHEGKIVVANELQPHFDDYKVRLLWWRLPRDQDPLQHAQVELLEEAGMVSDQFELLWKHEMQWNLKRNRYYYIVKHPRIVAQQTLDAWWETLELLTIPFDEFIDYVLHEWVWWLRLKSKIQELIIDDLLEDFRKNLFS